MSKTDLGINSWLEEELYTQYQHDRALVDADWQASFKSGNGAPAPAAPVSAPPVAAAPAPSPAVPPAANPAPAPSAAAPTPSAATSAEQLVPLRGVLAKIAENMNASLAVPTATSNRVIPVKVIDENRTLINEHRTMAGKGKVSYTHLVAWAILKALKTNPAINNAYAQNQQGEPFRAVRAQVNFGLAVDVAGKDGSRTLMVPNIKNAGGMSFAQFLAAFDDIVARARTGKMQPADFQGTSISLTNPGTVGTIGSVPRLMPGQGAIIATGAIDYPVEFAGVAPEMKAMLGLSKVMSISCTYDHRVIQGAESGMFLAAIARLLQGEDGFFEEIFADLKIPYFPVKLPSEKFKLLAPGLGGAAGSDPAEIAKEAAVLQLIHAYRVRGHLIANLNPLEAEAQYHPELDPATYGFTIYDLDRRFLTGSLGGAATGINTNTATLREILETLRQSYCGRMACEYMHIQFPEQKSWLQRQLEPKAARQPLDPADKKRILERLLEGEMFEHFLQKRFLGHKRFSLEGGESALAILDEVVERSAASGASEVVIGMAHRGRLTVLANLLAKSLVQIFSEFEGSIDPETTQGSGDVKYHLGASGVRPTQAGRDIVVSMAPNPSHLEAVDPVVEGIVRPKQNRLGDTARERVIPLLVHGDAAFAGQGVVMETLNLSQLEGYTTGGTIHLIINNQIGFTTNPVEARSGAYCTDVARMVQAPIFHVNGDDPEACARAIRIAYEFRQQFKRDVVVDMICYRRHGHNETDDPSYTQPVMYRRIEATAPVAQQYSEQLLREKTISKDDLEAIRKRVNDRLEAGYKAAKDKAEKFELVEMSGELDEEAFRIPHHQTAADRALLLRALEGLHRFPDTFRLHPKLKGFVGRRLEAAKGHPMDWATAEALAFGSLLLEGTPVRLSGQDCSRGTFSQRHLEFYDSETGALYMPIKHLDPKQARFESVDSSLSEYAVMGFEFGYSVADPLTLVLWEAQFGDFVNGAQIMIDQFIASAEEKWGQPSGLVLLLPHGMEGQGPEHSSARIERFLQLCAQNNMIAANATTPAQYFHLLRRQMYGGADRRGLRKPLIVFTPKSILRHAQAVSALDELTTGRFREVLGDPTHAGDRIRRVLFCSGKIYYDLLAAREQRQIQDVAIVRLEQLYPFPAAEIADVLARYSALAEVVWVQEEPRNMGAWRFMREWFEPVLEPARRTLVYVGRAEAASPAAGSIKRHQQEQAEVVDAAFDARALVKSRRVRVIAKRKKQ